MQTAGAALSDCKSRKTPQSGVQRAPLFSLLVSQPRALFGGRKMADQGASNAEPSTLSEVFPLCNQSTKSGTERKFVYAIWSPSNLASLVTNGVQLEQLQQLVDSLFGVRRVATNFVGVGVAQLGIWSGDFSSRSTNPSESCVECPTCSSCSARSYVSGPAVRQPLRALRFVRMKPSMRPGSPGARLPGSSSQEQ